LDSSREGVVGVRPRLDPRGKVERCCWPPPELSPNVKWVDAEIEWPDEAERAIVRPDATTNMHAKAITGPRLPRRPNSDKTVFRALQSAPPSVSMDKLVGWRYDATQPFGWPKVQHITVPARFPIPLTML